MDGGVLFRSHLGMGDQIACNGIVHFIRNKFPNKRVYVLAKTKNLANIEFMYKDFDDIEVVEIPGNDEDLETQLWLNSREDLDKIIYINSYIPWPNHMTDRYWDESFYKTVGLEYEVKLLYSTLPKIDEQAIMDKHVDVEGDYAFVYDDPERGFTFTPKTDLPIIKNKTDLNIFEMAPIIKNAKEVHTMLGGLVCLMELLKTPHGGQKGFLYPIRDDLNIYNKEKFEVVHG